MAMPPIPSMTQNLQAASGVSSADWLEFGSTGGVNFGTQNEKSSGLNNPDFVQGVLVGSMIVMGLVLLRGGK